MMAFNFYIFNVRVRKSDKYFSIHREKNLYLRVASGSGFPNSCSIVIKRLPTVNSVKKTTANSKKCQNFGRSLRLSEVVCLHCPMNFFNVFQRGDKIYSLLPHPNSCCFVISTLPLSIQPPSQCVRRFGFLLYKNFSCKIDLLKVCVEKFFL